MNILKLDQNKNKCKGKIFRYNESLFLSNNKKYGHHKDLTLLKRDSCKECEYCGNILSDLHAISFEEPDAISTHD